MKERSLEPPAEAKTRAYIEDDTESECCGADIEATDTLDRRDEVADTDRRCTKCGKLLGQFAVRPAGERSAYLAELAAEQAGDTAPSQQ